MGIPTDPPVGIEWEKLGGKRSGFPTSLSP